MPWLKVNGMSMHVRCDRRMAAKLKCAGCGLSTVDKRLCDWRLPDGSTCDAHCCEYCSIQPAPGKDVCREHAAALGEWFMESAA